ncbi:hypothetical protein M2375_002561 [Comamonas sp. BIGb0152]|uniref:hypothetical protein n=1 Tax=Comamonas sp. BIGb0152 TaxID=2940601 RepID=UPI002167BC6D|nr:hypothetical protein [Comamonas sp. BIGb0152]MCS4294328.1 hypothetical protein [Comamonas sp. BIGb0152]
MRMTAVPLLLACLLASTAACAKDASDYNTQELVEALTQRLSKVLLAGPTRDSPDNTAAIIVLEGKALALAPQLQSTPGMRVLSKEQLVAEQRSNFLIISQLGQQGPDMLVDYETPNNASYGTLRIQEKDGKLVFKAQDTYRSSSGARTTYARLYGGLPCRNGSEMAYRFNYANRFVRSGECPTPRFPTSDSPFEW